VITFSLALLEKACNVSFRWKVKRQSKTSIFKTANL
jgi:hypothetical protein